MLNKDDNELVAIVFYCISTVKLTAYERYRFKIL